MLSIRPLRKSSAAVLAIIMSGLALGFDLSQPLGVSAGIPYVVLPLLGLLARSSPLIIIAALAGTALIAAGAWLSPPGVDMGVVLLNRAMSAALVWVTALMALRHLHVGNRLRKQLRELAATDPLTGLYNRRHLFELLHRELRRYERYRETFALILIDADHFKRINDTYGHAVGDTTLRFIAETCLKSVRETDVVGRFGGEEFLILLPHTATDDAVLVAERIRRFMHDPDARPNDDAVPVTLSIGVAEAGPDTETFDSILKAADDALYAAKRGGRDRVSAFERPKIATREVDAA